jgi:hypothetical protein
MGLGIFVIIPIDAILLLFYTILSFSVYRTVKHYLDYPDDIKVFKIYVLGILSLLLPILFGLNEMNIL